MFYIIAHAEKLEEPDLRIVLLGKAGGGKTSTGNTILRRKAFNMNPCESPECQKETIQFDGQTLAVVDTPDMFKAKKTEEEMKTEIIKCFPLAAPGPHVFLVVIQAGRFTEEEQETVQIIQEMFGLKLRKYTKVLITHGDDLKADGDSIEKIINENPALRHFINWCQGGYHVFNNRDKDPSQVRELLEKISIMVQRNGGSCYTTEMFKEAERERREKIDLILRQNPDMTLQEARSAQRKNMFNQASGSATVALTISAGAVVGLMGAAVGGVLGGTVGVIGGAVGAIGVSALRKNQCVMQ